MKSYSFKNIFYSFLFTFLLQMLFFNSAGNAEELRIINPFAGEVKSTPETASSDFICNVAPRPVINMVFPKAYDRRNLTRGDWPLYERNSYKKAIKNLTNYEKKISDMANRYKITRGKENGLVANCLVSWLNSWAKKDALLGKSNDTGKIMRKWVLASISSSYAQVINFKYINKTKDAQIKSWINDLAYSVIYDFSINRDKTSRKNNHLYWAAWAVGISSVILQDRILFNWTMDKMLFAMHQITKNGTLPLELKRKSMALHYHTYALGALISIANLALVNGYKVDFYKENNSALHRLVFRVLKGLDKNNKYFDKATGFKQKRSRALTPYNLAWLEIYNKIYPSVLAVSLIEKLRPMKQRRLGGNLSLLYGGFIR